MSEPLSLKCPSCASPLQQAGMNPEEGFIKCNYCGALMTLPSVGARPAAFRERPPLALPPGMAIQSTAHGLEITRRWFSIGVFFLIPFCIVWNGFLVFWYSMAFKSGAPLLFKPFSIIHVAVGVGLTYLTLAMLVNKTRIRVERGEITLTHGPLPWFGFRRMPGVMIDQIYAKVHVSHGKNGPRTDYQLWLVNNTGNHEKLHANGLTSDQALYIEQQMEKALGIKDRAVSGELPR